MKKNVKKPEGSGKVPEKLPEALGRVQSPVLKDWPSGRPGVLPARPGSLPGGQVDRPNLASARPAPQLPEVRPFSAVHRVPDLGRRTPSSRTAPVLPGRTPAATGRPVELPRIGASPSSRTASVPAAGLPEARSSALPLPTPSALAARSEVKLAALPTLSRRGVQLPTLPVSQVRSAPASASLPGFKSRPFVPAKLPGPTAPQPREGAETTQPGGIRGDFTGSIRQLTGKMEEMIRALTKGPAPVPETSPQQFEWSADYNVAPVPESLGLYQPSAVTFTWPTPPAKKK